MTERELLGIVVSGGVAVGPAFVPAEPVAAPDGGGPEAALAALARVVPGIRIERAPDEPSRWPSLTRGPLSSDRLRHDLGWTPTYDLDSGLTTYVAWLRAQPAD